MGQLKPAQTSAKPNGTNLRMAEAGRIILDKPGTSLFQALTDAGYAESTARRPAANGLTVDRCIAEAVKLEPDVDPSELLKVARLRLHQRLNRLQGKALDETRLGEIARTVDVVEKYYAGHDPSRGEREARTTVDRMEQLAFVLRELERRGKISVNLEPALPNAHEPTDP